MLSTALQTPACQVFYVSTTKLRAAATVWDSLVDQNREASLGGRPNYSNHVILMPNGSKVWVTGCENKKMADDLRGRRRPKLYVLDELQDFSDDLLRYIVEKVIMPSLADVGGSVLLMGTGGSPRGFYYEAQAEDSTWNIHRWTPFDNPHLMAGEARALVDKAMRDRGVTEDDPSIQREFYGRFVADLTRQIFPISEINLYDDLPQGRYTYVIGGDVGAVDATAAVVWAWPGVGRKLYEVHSDEARGLPVSGQVAFFEALIREYREKGPLLAVAIDPGGGGKGLILELQGRYNLPIISAEKTEKPAMAVTMRSDLLNGTIQIRRSSTKLRAALQQPEWDPDNVGTALKGHWPDLADSCLYGYRHCYQYLSPVPEPPKSVEQRMEDEQREYLERHQRMRERDDFLS